MGESHTIRPQIVFRSPPPDPIVRVGRLNSNIWTPTAWSHTRRKDDGTFGYRYDDPRKRYDTLMSDSEMFRMVYAATDFSGAFCEAASGRRPRLTDIAAYPGQPPEGVSVGIIDEEWCRTRAAGYTVLHPDLLFVDVASHETTNALRTVPSIAKVALEMNHVDGDPDIDPSILKGPCRELPQEVARYIYEGSSAAGNGLPGQPAKGIVAGIRYLSRHSDEGNEYECWAIFDTRMVHAPGDNIQLSIRPGSTLAPRIREAVKYLGLVLELT